MTFMRQLAALLGVSLLSLYTRRSQALTLVLGITCTVGVLVSMLAMCVGARRHEMADARTDRVVLVSVGAPDATQSSISKDQAASIGDLPGIRLGPDRAPIAVSELLVTMEARERGDGRRVSFPLVGVTSGLGALIPELHLTAGRMFRPGLDELIASNLCARQFPGFALGDRREIQGIAWAVVGRFDQGQGEEGCLVYADAGSAFAAFRRDSYNQVTVMLQSPSGYSALQNAVAASPMLRVDARRESQVIAEQYERFNGILYFASYFVGVVMALGATLGAANSLYAIVDGRRRELATLRAVGFGFGPVVASMLLESELLAVPGALLGAALAWAFFNGLSASPFGFTFQLAVTVQLVALGVAWALVIGLLAGLLPALRAAGMSVTGALRAGY
ncbi:MAG TPA: ABC transporter permease [Steroidobacteraceae bacterium]